MAVISLLSSPAHAIFGGGNNNPDIEVEAKGYGGDASAKAAGVGIGTGGKAEATGGNANQDQSQAQIGINKSTNKNKVNTSDYNRNSSYNKNSNDSGVEASGNSFNEVNAGGDTLVAEGDNIVYEAPDIPVETAYAPTVITTSDCLGSIAGGTQSKFWGATFGITTQSEPCNVREDAKVAASLVKDEFLVKATLCQSDRIAEAYKVKGEYHKYCVGAKETTKTSYWGLVNTPAYEDVCKYPTEKCRLFKAGRL